MIQFREFYLFLFIINRNSYVKRNIKVLDFYELFIEFMENGRKKFLDGLYIENILVIKMIEKGL